VADETRQTLTVQQAAQRLGIGRWAAYEAVRAGQIPSLRVGRRILVPLPAFEKMLLDARQPCRNGAATRGSR